MNRPDKAEKLKFELEKLANKRGTDIRNERKRKKDRKSETKELIFIYTRQSVSHNSYYNKLQINISIIRAVLK